MLGIKPILCRLLHISLVDNMGTTLGMKTNAVDKYMNTVVRVHEKAVGE